MPAKFAVKLGMGPNGVVASANRSLQRSIGVNVVGWLDRVQFGALANRHLRQVANVAVEFADWPGLAGRNHGMCLQIVCRIGRGRKGCIGLRGFCGARRRTAMHIGCC
jgi:hypothetical protein